MQHDPTVADLATQTPTRIEVTTEQYDRLIDELDRPTQPLPRLAETLRRPTVFD